MSAYRDELPALSARHEALTAQLTEKAREVEAAAILLEEARARVRLPVLDHIRIAAPCKAGWENMVGDDKVRFCGLCEKNVYNLSELTRAEAEALILEKEGDLCGRYYQRKDGTILTRDCSVGVRQRRKRGLVAAGAALLAGTGAFFAAHHEETRCAAPREERLRLDPVAAEIELAPLSPPATLQRELEQRLDELERVDGYIAMSPELEQEMEARRRELQRATMQLDLVRAKLADAADAADAAGPAPPRD
jgi:uncharacterized protein YhaN